MKKKRNAAGIIMTVLAGVLAAVLLLTVAGWFVFKLCILPKYTRELEQRGHGEIAAVVEQNSNLGSLAVLGSALADRNVMSFLSGIDRDSAKSMLEVMSELEESVEENNAAAAGELTVDGTWNVSDPVQYMVTKPTPVVPVSTPEPIPVPQSPAVSTTTPTTAYERIAAVATAEEMAEGLRIISKVDISYVTSLTAGGLTPEEKAELKAYVASRLTGAEISRAMALYNKYSKYL